MEIRENAGSLTRRERFRVIGAAALVLLGAGCYACMVWYDPAFENPEFLDELTRSFRGFDVPRSADIVRHRDSPIPRSANRRDCLARRHLSGVARSPDSAHCLGTRDEPPGLPSTAWNTSPLLVYRICGCNNLCQDRSVNPGAGIALRGIPPQQGIDAHVISGNEMAIASFYRGLGSDSPGDPQPRPGRSAVHPARPLRLAAVGPGRDPVGEVRRLSAGNMTLVVFLGVVPSSPCGHIPASIRRAFGPREARRDSRPSLRAAVATSDNAHLCYLQWICAACAGHAALESRGTGLHCV